MMILSSKDSNRKGFTLPNKLTISRILLIPFFIIFLVKEYHGFAIVTFGLAGLTDALDGLLARVLNQKSKLGSVLDPIADKLLINTSFMTLAVMKCLPGWLAMVVVTRDLLIILGVMAIYMVDHKLIFSPTLIGKSTTLIQMVTILLALFRLFFHGISLYLLVFIWLTTCLTIISGLHYIYQAAKLRDRSA